MTTLQEAATSLVPTVQALEAAITVSSSKEIDPKTLGHVRSSLPGRSSIPSAEPLHEAVSVLITLSRRQFVTPKEADKAFNEVRAIMEPLAQGKPAFGPGSSAGVIDWYHAALGDIADVFANLAHVEYVRAKAGSFGARQEANRLDTTLESARNLLTWVIESEESDRISAPT